MNVITEYLLKGFYSYYSELFVPIGNLEMQTEILIRWFIAEIFMYPILLASFIFIFVFAFSDNVKTIKTVVTIGMVVALIVAVLISGIMSEKSITELMYAIQRLIISSQ